MHPELTQFEVWLKCQYPHSSVRKHYMSDLALFFSWARKPPSAIDFHDVDNYIHHCLSKGLSPLTINRRLSSLRTFYYFLSIVNDVSMPCPVILRRHFLRKPQPLPRDASEEQIEILFAHIHHPRDTAIFTLMLECGLRVGEVHNLSLEDILPDDPPRLRIHGKGDKHRTCEIRDLQVRDVNLPQHSLRIRETKNQRERVVYLSLPTVEAVQTYLANRKDASNYLFTRHHKPLSNRYCQSRLNTIGKEVNIKATPHQLRHTCATLLLNTGMSIFALQSLLGHKYVDTTLRYARTYDATVAKDCLEATSKIHQIEI